ncbi:glycosyltransferase family 2 protein [Brachymonas sp. M4Q-1]|uniref:glycosyltransferase family 2 protein n=1 Tax=Brachymonas sp. M4Q-1 TaxID=3416906 RepID=UPI003CF72FEB
MSSSSSSSPAPASAPAPWLSVLIPVYNVEAYLVECVESVMAQADPGVEVLLLDDCSTDASPARMHALAARWPGRLQLLQHTRNRGLSAARNTLIEAAHGDYLWFLDSDDKLLPGAIPALQRIVGQQHPDMVVCDFAVWRESPRLKHRLRGERHRRSFAGPARTLLTGPARFLADLLRPGQLHAWSKISRRALWSADLRFPEGAYFEDMATMPHLALRARTVWYEPLPWVAYRQRGSSILSQMTPAKARDLSGALTTFRHALQGTEWDAEPAVRFAVAHVAARNFIGAAGHLARCRTQMPPAEWTTAMARCRDDFLQQSPLSPAQLERAYVTRGWWLRGLKFHRHFSLR